MWFNTEGEQRLKDSYATDDTLVCTEKAFQHFNLFLAQSKVLQQFNKYYKSHPYLAVCVSLDIPTVFLSFTKAENI